MNVSEQLIREIVTKVLQEAGGITAPQMERQVDPSGIIGIKTSTVPLQPFEGRNDVLLAIMGKIISGSLPAAKPRWSPNTKAADTAKATFADDSENRRRPCPLPAGRGPGRGRERSGVNYERQRTADP